MAWYNLTALNASSVLEITKSVKKLYFNPLGEIILLMIYFISFISFTYFNNNPKLNFMFSSFAVAIFSIPLKVFNLISDITPFLCWGFFGLSIAIVTLTK